MKPFEARIEVDGKSWYRGQASCILVGNVGELFGGVHGTLTLGSANPEGSFKPALKVS